MGATILVLGLWLLVWPHSEGEDPETLGDPEGPGLTTPIEVGELSNTAAITGHLVTLLNEDGTHLNFTKAFLGCGFTWLSH